MFKQFILLSLCVMGSSKCSINTDAAKQLVVAKQAQKTALNFISLPRDLQQIILGYVGKGWQISENTQLQKEINDLYFYDDALLVCVSDRMLKPVFFGCNSIDKDWIRQLELLLHKEPRVDLTGIVALSEEEKQMPITIYSNSRFGGKESRGMGAYAYLNKNYTAIIHPMDNVIEIKNKKKAAKNIVDHIDANHTVIEFVDLEDQIRHESYAQHAMGANKFMYERIAALCMSRYGHYLVYAYHLVRLLKSEIRIVNLQNGEKVSSFWTPDTVIHMALSPNNRYIVLSTCAITGTNRLRIHDIEENHTEVIEQNEREQAINSVAFSPDGKYLFTGNSQGKIKKLELQPDLSIV